MNLLYSVLVMLCVLTAVSRQFGAEVAGGDKTVYVYDEKGEPKEGVEITIAYPSSPDLIKGVTDEKGVFSLGVRGWMFSDFMAIAEGVRVTVRKGVLPKPPLKLSLPKIELQDGGELEEVRVVTSGKRYDKVMVDFKGSDDGGWQRMVAANNDGAFRPSAPLAAWSLVEISCVRGDDEVSVRILRSELRRSVKALVVTLPIDRWGS